MNCARDQRCEPAPDELTGADGKAKLTLKTFENKFNLVMVVVTKNFSNLFSYLLRGKKKS